MFINEIIYWSIELICAKAYKLIIPLHLNPPPTSHPLIGYNLIYAQNITNHCQISAFIDDFISWFEVIFIAIVYSYGNSDTVIVSLFIEFIF